RGIACFGHRDRTRVAVSRSSDVWTYAGGECVASFSAVDLYCRRYQCGRHADGGEPAMCAAGNGIAAEVLRHAVGASSESECEKRNSDEVGFAWLNGWNWKNRSTVARSAE